jgi:hypothetical protein
MLAHSVRSIRSASPFQEFMVRGSGMRSQLIPVTFSSFHDIIAPTWNHLTDEEKAWIWSTIDQAISVIQSRHSPNGFNVGFNLGSTAGRPSPTSIFM